MTVDNLGGVLTQFINGDVSFASNPAKKRPVVTIDLSNDDQKRGLVYVLQAILSRRYAPLGRAEVSTHCG